MRGDAGKMTHTSPAERTLFSDLTRLFMMMRDAPYTQMEAMIEERFREFARAHPDHKAGGLQITLSWTLPDGADDWAVYGTEYKTLPAADIMPQPRRAVAGGSADIVEFPGGQLSRSIAPTGGPARILPFPGR
jgi:hypothetical protein